MKTTLKKHVKSKKISCSKINSYAERIRGLRESERKFKAIFNQTFQFIGLLKPDGTLIEVNKTALDFIGANELDVIGKLFWDTPWWDHSNEMQDKLKIAVQNAAEGQLVRFEATHRSFDKSTHYIDFSIKPEKDKNGRIIYLIPEGRDITERKMSEKALLEERNFSREILDGVPAIVCGIKPDGTTTFVNPACEKITGYPAGELIGKNWWNSFYPGDEYVQVDELHGKLQDGNIQNYEMVLTTSNGEKRIISWNFVGRYGKDNMVELIIGLGNDITEHKQAENALKESEMKLKMLFENTSVAVFIIKDGLYVHCNDKALDVLRCSKYQVIDKPPLAFFPERQPYGEDSAEGASQYYAAALAGKPQQFEWTFCRCDGTLFEAEVNLNKLVLKKVVYIQAVVRDISLRKKAERELYAKSVKLQETNTALKILLEKMEESKKDLEDNLLTNIKLLILPYIEKMSKLNPNELQKSYLDIIQDNLTNITTPFLHDLKQFNFTPMEIKVTHFIKNGKTTKEIAGLLGTSQRAVDIHRNNIRKKLGISNKKINLQTHLMSIH